MTTTTGGETGGWPSPEVHLGRGVLLRYVVVGAVPRGSAEGQDLDQQQTGDSVLKTSFSSSLEPTKAFQPGACPKVERLIGGPLGWAPLILA